MMRCLEWKGQGKGPHQLSRAQPAPWVIAKGMELYGVGRPGLPGVQGGSSSRSWPREGEDAFLSAPHSALSGHNGIPCWGFAHTT